jgi:hypothetical protein
MVQVKKALMTYIWRIQQSQMIISIVFWSLTLTGIFYQYFAPLFDIYLGVPQENVFLGMLLLLFIVLAGVIVIGFAYDRIFRLWQESSIVNVERNPYSRLLMMPKEILLWKRCQLRILKIEFMDKWFDKLLEDPKIAKQVEETEKTILS